MTVKFFPNDKGNPPGKLADVEIHFDTIGDVLTDAIAERLQEDPRMDDAAEQVAEAFAAANLFAGLKLVGFAVWDRTRGGRTVTFPARQYSVNGERRSFALLRPLIDAAAQDRLRDVILAAYAEHEATAAATVD